MLTVERNYTLGVFATGVRSKICEEHCLKILAHNTQFLSHGVVN
jgi:hypothetical protein